MHWKMKWKCRNCSPYLSVKIPSSPDIHDPGCQDLEDSIKGMPWAEACLGREAFPWGVDLPGWEGMDAGAAANPSVFLFNCLTHLHGLWELSTCSGVSGTVPAWPRELSSGWEAGIKWCLLKRDQPRKTCWPGCLEERGVSMVSCSEVNCSSTVWNAADCGDGKWGRSIQDCREPWPGCCSSLVEDVPSQRGLVLTTTTTTPTFLAGLPSTSTSPWLSASQLDLSTVSSEFNNL